MADVAAGLESLSLDPTPQAPRLPPSSATAIDKDGDLYLAVGPDGRAFQVDSRAIIRASEVWKKMLTGGWAESRPAEGAWVVELSGDDPRAMEVVLHIIHLNNRHIPRRLSGEELFNVATLVDLYQVGGCLGLWAKTWCEPAVRELKGQAVQFEFQDLLRLTWIGWVFGNRVIFERAVNKLVLEVEIDGEGCLVDPAGIYLDEFRFLRAMDLESHLAHCRLQLVSSLLHIVENVAQGLIERTSSYCRCRRVSGMRSQESRDKARADCDAAMLGSLIQELAAADLFPIPAGEDIFESAISLKDKLTSVSRGIKTLGIPVPGERHVDCHPGDRLLKQLDEVMFLAREAAVTDSQIEHLKKQAMEIEGRSI